MAFKFKNADAIDEAIKTFINSMPRKGGQNTHNQAWDDDILELRNMVVYDYIRQGLSYRRICEELANRWDITLATAGKYYKGAMNALVTSNEDVIDEARKSATERLLGIIESCYDRGLYNEALRAQEQLNKINGLYTEKQEIEVKGISFDFGERE